LRRIDGSEEDMPQEAAFLIQNDVLIPVRTVQFEAEQTVLEMQPQRFEDRRKNFDLFNFVERNFHSAEPGVKLEAIVEDFIFLPKTFGGAVGGINRWFIHKGRRRLGLRGRWLKAIAPVSVEIVRDLIEGGGVLFKLAVGAGGMREETHVHDFGIAGIEFGGLHEAQDDKAVASQHADVAVVIKKGAALLGWKLQ